MWSLKFQCCLSIQFKFGVLELSTFCQSLIAFPFQFLYSCSYCHHGHVISISYQGHVLDSSSLRPVVMYVPYRRATYRFLSDSCRDLDFYGATLRFDNQRPVLQIAASDSHKIFCESPLKGLIYMFPVGRVNGVFNVEYS